MGISLGFSYPLGCVDYFSLTKGIVCETIAFPDLVVDGHFAEVAELVDAADSKSVDFGLEGSSPSFGTFFNFA